MNIKPYINKNVNQCKCNICFVQKSKTLDLNQSHTLGVLCMPPIILTNYPLTQLSIHSCQNDSEDLLINTAVAAMMQASFILEDFNEKERGDSHLGAFYFMFHSHPGSHLIHGNAINPELWSLIQLVLTSSLVISGNSSNLARYFTECRSIKLVL